MNKVVSHSKRCGQPGAPYGGPRQCAALCGEPHPVYGNRVVCRLCERRLYLRPTGDQAGCAGRPVVFGSFWWAKIWVCEKKEAVPCGREKQKPSPLALTTGWNRIFRLIEMFDRYGLKGTFNLKFRFVLECRSPLTVKGVEVPHHRFCRGQNPGDLSKSRSGGAHADPSGAVRFERRRADPRNRGRPQKSGKTMRPVT